MAKDRNTVAKRQREVEKKRKAEEKRARKQRKKDEPIGYVPAETSDRSAADEA